MLESPPFIPVGTGCSFLPEDEASRAAITLLPSAHEALRADAVDALRSLPRKGLEIGGILLGDYRDAITIDSIRAVGIEHLYGPRYILSDLDRQRFSEAVRLEAHQGQSSRPVGLYRTITTEGEGVTADDHEWVRRHVGDRQAVLLIVAPKLTGRVTLSCFYSDGRQLIPCRETPLAPVAPKGEAAPRVVSRFVSEGESKSRVNPRAIGWMQEAGLAAVAGFLVFGGIFLFHHERASARVEQTSVPDSPRRIGLRAESSGEGTRITWNNKSELFRTALGALLSVDDAGLRKELPITLAELQTGSIVYGPASAGSVFQFTVFRGDGDVHESIASSEHSVSPAAQKSAPVPPRPASQPQARPVHTQQRIRQAAVPASNPSPKPLKLPPPVTSGSGSIFPKE